MDQPAQSPSPTDRGESPTPEPRSIAGDSRSLVLGVLSNGLSGRNRRGGLKAARRILAGFDQVRHYEVTTPDEVAQALADLSHRGTEVVAVNAGDGTVQAVLSSLFRDRPFHKLPLLAILPGGTTNMTAGDVGVGRHPGRSLHRLLRWTQARDREVSIESRSVLRVQTSPEAPAMYGMFFGTAGIVQGTRFFHDRVQTLGLRGEVGPGITIARLLLDVIRGGGEHLSPESVTVELDGRAPERQEWLMILVSTLERLFLGLRPFWSKEDGPLHFTALRARPRHLLPVLPWLLRGRAHRRLTPPNGYFSHNVTEIRLSLDTAFTLDGQIFPVDSRTGPVVLGDGGAISFVRL